MTFGPINVAAASLSQRALLSSFVQGVSEVLDAAMIKRPRDASANDIRGAKSPVATLPEDSRAFVFADNVLELFTKDNLRLLHHAEVKAWLQVLFVLIYKYEPYLAERITSEHGSERLTVRAIMKDLLEMFASDHFNEDNKLVWRWAEMECAIY